VPPSALLLSCTKTTWGIKQISSRIKKIFKMQRRPRTYRIANVAAGKPLSKLSAV
jgi:hypothetical protein